MYDVLTVQEALDKHAHLLLQRRPLLHKQDVGVDCADCAGDPKLIATRERGAEAGPADRSRNIGRHRLAVHERLLAHDLDQHLTEAAAPDPALNSIAAQGQRGLDLFVRRQDDVGSKRGICPGDRPLWDLTFALRAAAWPPSLTASKPCRPDRNVSQVHCRGGYSASVAAFRRDAPSAGCLLSYNANHLGFSQWNQWFATFL